MKQQSLRLKMLCIAFAAAFLVSSCASTTMIQSVPNNASIYIDGALAGVTPYQHTDSKIIGSNTEVKLEKAGYETYFTNFSRFEEPDPGPIICGVIFTPIWWLWGAKYKANRTFHMIPLSDQQEPENLNESLIDSTQKLRELKQLLDEGTITQEEFDTEKKKILKQ